jgi:hypothetical protein
VGHYLLMAYLPPQHAVAGTKLVAFHPGEHASVTCSVVGSTPMFDPTDEHIRR